MLLLLIHAVLFMEGLLSEHSFESLVSFHCVKSHAGLVRCNLTEYASNIALESSQFLEHWDELAQFIVCHVLVP